MSESTFYPEMHIALTFEGAIQELQEMEKPPLEIVCVDLNRSDTCMATVLFEIAAMKAKSPFAVLVILTGLLRSRDAGGTNQHHMNELLCHGPHDPIKDKTFLEKLRDVIKGLLRQPQVYQRSSHLLEALTTRLYRKAETDTAIAKDRWRR